MALLAALPQTQCCNCGLAFLCRSYTGATPLFLPFRGITSNMYLSTTKIQQLPLDDFARAGRWTLNDEEWPL